MGDSDTDGWPNGRRAVTYREARAVLDAQQATMADIDEKALRTVRIALLLAGLVLTTVRLSRGTVSLGLALPGIAGLLVSVTAGVITYSESDIHLGPNRAYIRQLERNDFTGRTWDTDLVLTLGEWVGSKRGRGRAERATVTVRTAITTGWWHAAGTLYRTVTAEGS